MNNYAVYKCIKRVMDSLTFHSFVPRGCSSECPLLVRVSRPSTPSSRPRTPSSRPRTPASRPGTPASIAVARSAGSRPSTADSRPGTGGSRPGSALGQLKDQVYKLNKKFYCEHHAVVFPPLQLL